MAWHIAAIAGASLLQGLMSNKAEQKAVRAQNKAAYQQNVLNWQETRAGIMALEGQRAALRNQTTKNLQLAVRAANQSRGATNADIAAVGIKGNSTDQVLGDIERDFQEHQYELENQHLYSIHDIDQQGVNMISAAIAGNAPMQKAQGSTKDALLSAGLQAASSYAGSYFNFGASGKTPIMASPDTFGRTTSTAAFRGTHGISTGQVSTYKYRGGTWR